MPTSLPQALDQFIERYLELYRDTPAGLPLIDYDADWPSECYQGPADRNHQSPWKPVRQTTTNPLFDGLSAALETEIHRDIRDYYNRYWSDPIAASSADGDLSLLFVWNDEDFERLRANLIGHALNKRRQKLPLTLFFACTEPEELVLSLENSSGRILLEQPGQPPIREIAPSLEEFLHQLSPRLS